MMPQHLNGIVANDFQITKIQFLGLQQGMANARSMYFDSDKIPRRILARVLHQVIAVTEADLDDLIDGAAKDIV